LADDLREALARGLHLSSPAGMASILTQGDYSRPKHLDYINDILVDTMFGTTRRLIVSAPPRHGKSQLMSVWYPTWRLAHRPTDTIGIICHTHALARDFGLEIRTHLLEYFPEIGIELAEDSKAAARWRTKQGGGVLAFGVDGAPIGVGFNCLISDDVFPNAVVAESDVSSDAAWRQYQWVAYSRMEPKSTIIVTHQRWNDRDLIGRLLAAQGRGPKSEGYDNWRVVTFPALAEPNDPLGRQVGEALWPARYDEGELERVRVSQGDYAFAAMQQQRPSPKGGGVFRNSLWNYWVPRGMANDLGPVRVDGRECEVRELPDTWDAQIQSWDCNYLSSVRSMEMGRDTDPVAGHVWGRSGPNYFLIDRVWGRFGLDQTIHHVRAMTVKHPAADAKLIENTANGPSVMARLKNEVGGFIAINPRGSKISRVRQIHEATTEDQKNARALTMESALQSGNFFIPHPSFYPWAEEYRNLMGKFPKDGKDDTDATSQAWAYLTRGQWSDLRRAHMEALNTKGPLNTMDEFKERIQKMTEAAIKKNRPPSPSSVYFR
jgi:predicted phage terminase large subunit-like protein